MKRLKASLTADEIQRIGDTLALLEDIEANTQLARALRTIYDTIFEDAPDPLPRCWRCGGETTMGTYVEGGRDIAAIGCDSCHHYPVIAEGPNAHDDAIRAARVLEKEFLGGK